MAQFTFGTEKPSGNRKTGPLFSTYRAVSKPDFEGTCPKSCPFLYKCYANFHFTNMRSNAARERHQNVTDYIVSLPRKAIVRHLVSGDLSLNGKVDYEYINEMLEGHKQRPDIKGYGYTHMWREIDPKMLNALPNLTFNASVESPSDVLLASAMGWPIARVLNNEQTEKFKEDGVTTIICPSQTADVQCNQCMLCFKEDRKFHIGFMPHGVNKKSIGNAVINLESV